MWKTEPFIMDQNRTIPSERNPLSTPQIFVHLEFGVSWSQRHTPRTHSLTYTSRNLRDARARGNFPRQLPAPNTNFLVVSNVHEHGSREPASDRLGRQLPHQSQHATQNQHHGYSYRVSGRTRNPEGAQPPLQPQQGQRTMNQRRESRSEARGITHERGKSAPPPFHDSPWDDAPGPSEPLPLTVQQTRQGQPHVWKPLPAAPSAYRLGEDGMPWSAWAWPPDTYDPLQVQETEVDLPYSNQPTTVPISPRRHRGDDPERVRELETLSAAMMTVDNGFENQWWYQGPRETTTWRPRDQETPTRLNMAEALLLAAAEPPQTIPPLHGWYAPVMEDHSSTMDAIVSPMSSISSPTRPLQRTMTTRSEELFY
ncbi:hypothetical protein BX600DRAFT_470505 [Xylariales sp. PMI_506]|nr:hypothetical protein BX600DRAFT_470505 [Xylariales sp. PMI_506]